jgi:hypothetical protein
MLKYNNSFSGGNCMRKIETIVVTCRDNMGQMILDLEKEGFRCMEASLLTLRQFGEDAICVLWREIRSEPSPMPARETVGGYT